MVVNLAWRHAAETAHFRAGNALTQDAKKHGDRSTLERKHHD